MTDLGRKWNGEPASVRVVSRGELRAARSRGLDELTPGGVRQYDIVYPPQATAPGRPRGHPASGHADYSGYGGARDGAGYAYEYPQDRATQADKLAALERQLAALADRIAALEKERT